MVRRPQSKVHAIGSDQQLIKGQLVVRWRRSVIPQTLMQEFSDQTAGGPRLPVTNEIMMKITAITSST